MKDIITTWVLTVDGKEVTSWEGDMLGESRPEIANRFGVTDLDYIMARRLGSKTWYCAGRVVLRPRNDPQTAVAVPPADGNVKISVTPNNCFLTLRELPDTKV